MGRAAAGLLFLILPVWGPAWWGDNLSWQEALLGLVGIPAVLLAAHAGRLAFSRRPLQASNEMTFCLNLAIWVVLFSLSLTRDAAALFLGASLLLAVARGYAGCEVTAVSNWILRRNDQIGCVLFSPLDALERRAIGP